MTCFGSCPDYLADHLVDSLRFSEWNRDGNLWREGEQMLQQNLCANAKISRTDVVIAQRSSTAAPALWVNCSSSIEMMRSDSAFDQMTAQQPAATPIRLRNESNLLDSLADAVDAHVNVASHTVLHDRRDRCTRPVALCDAAEFEDLVARLQTRLTGGRIFNHGVDNIKCFCRRGRS